MQIEKKNNVTYKTTLNQMLSYMIKFGVGELTNSYLYNYIDKKTNLVYPVTILNQIENPWDSNFYTVNLFMTSNNLENINIYDTDSNKDYEISSSSLLDVKEVKDALKDKNLVIEFEKNNNGIYNLKNLPIKETINDRFIGFVDKFTKFKTLKDVINKNIDEFKTIPEYIIPSICTGLVENTNYTIINKDKHNKVLKLFYSIIPFVPDGLKYFQKTKTFNDETISTIYLLQYVKSLTIHNFYNYVDIWNFDDGELFNLDTTKI